MTVCCRKCKTQITLPEAPDARMPPWYATRYWIAVVVAGGLLLASLAACILLHARSRAPEGLPLLHPELAGGGGPRLATPGAPLTLRWTAGRESAGGCFAIEGQRVALFAPDERELPEVALRQKRWSHGVFKPDQAPAFRPIALEFRVRLPQDLGFEGTQAVLRVSANVEYPGRAAPGGPVTLQRASVTREWAFTFATLEQQVALSRHLRARRWTQAGAIVSAVLFVALGVAAGLFAHRHLGVQCPKCGRTSVATYYLGGSKLHISACPHYGSRLVTSRRG
jgi:hypothetical protein